MPDEPLSASGPSLESTTWLVLRPTGITEYVAMQSRVLPKEDAPQVGEEPQR